MNQSERRIFLIKYLLKENTVYSGMQIPADSAEQKRLLRSLMNIRMPGPADTGFLKIQDEYLQQVNKEKGVIALDDMQELQPDLYVWKGDITRL